MIMTTIILLLMPPPHPIRSIPKLVRYEKGKVTFSYYDNDKYDEIVANDDNKSTTSKHCMAAFA